MASRRRDKRDDDSPRPLDDAKLYIGNLSEHIRESELEEAFRQYGKIRDCRIITESGSGRSKGFAFITFEKAEDGNQAKKETNDKLELNGKRLVVETARGGEKQNRRSDPYDKNRPRRSDYDSRDRREGYDNYGKYPDDRDRRRDSRYPMAWPHDYPPPWAYPGNPNWRELPYPHLDRNDPSFRRDEREGPYSRFPYPFLPYPPDDYYMDRPRDRHSRDGERGHHRDNWERESREGGRREYPNERDRESRDTWERESRDNRREYPNERDRESRDTWERDSRRDSFPERTSSTSGGEEGRREEFNRSSSTTSNPISTSSSSSSSSRDRERKEERYDGRESRTESSHSSGDRHRNDSQDRRRS